MTDEAVHFATCPQQSLPDCPADRWKLTIDACVEFRWPDVDRVVVVSPHPDDETLGLGGLISMACARGLEVLVIAVTNGEAGGYGADLGNVRSRELDEALRTLGGATCIAIERLRLPDGSVHDHDCELRDQLELLCRSSDLLCCPLIDDWHSDHEATSRAVRHVGRKINCDIRWYPIWSWEAHDPATSRLRRSERIVLTETAQERKRKAMFCYASQLTGREPVLSSRVLDHFCRDVEMLLRPSWSD